MRAPGVVEADPVANDPTRVLQRLEPMPSTHCSFSVRIARSTLPFLFGHMGRDELLTNPVAAHKGGVAATGEDQAIVGAQQERRWYAIQCSEAGDQRLL